jgi:erythromycin esterase
MRTLNKLLALLFLLTFFVCLGQPTSSQERKPDEAAKSWLADNAIRLRTVEAGNGFADMQPLKKAIGNARVVALGEATHGTREFFQLKHRMLEFLVSEMGFTVFAIEATMPEAFDINEYVLTGRGDPAKALSGLYFWTWDTEEVLAMIEWMRRYNADPKHTKKVKFYGFDMQSAARAAKVTLAYLRKVDPAQAETAEKELGLLTNPLSEQGFSQLSKERKDAAFTAIKTVLARFDQQRQEYANRSSADEWAIARQHARVLSQNIEMWQSGNLGPAMMNVRDRSMAENALWILEREGPGAKAVLWAHNGHVANANRSGVQWMGWNLRKALGNEMYVFGFAFNQGGFQAVDMPFGAGKGLRAFDVQPAPEGSLDATLAGAGLQIAAIDLRAAPRAGAVAGWFKEARATRSIGAGYGEQMAAQFLAKQVVSDLYDGLLFVEKTTAARPVVKDQRLPSQKLDAPANLDFESGETGKIPAEWRPLQAVPEKYDFNIATSEDRPHSGKRCAMIARLPGKHYGEMMGGLTQRLNATSYRDKRIRLRVAARAEIKGIGDNAYVILRVTKQGIGPQSTAFDSRDKNPIASAEWREYEIVADVPKDADTISYGLFLVGDGKAWLDTVLIEVVEK